MTLAARLRNSLAALCMIAGCGGQENVDFKGPPLVATATGLAREALAERKARRSGAGKKAPPTRDEIEKSGEPVLRAVIASRGLDSLLSVFESRDDVIVWKTKSGTSLALRDGVLIQTRGLGPDLMSSVVPSVGQLLQDGGTHQRQYFFLGPNDQPTRRTYDCTVTIVGAEEIVIFERSHKVTHATEDCFRPQTGKITNDFWIEGRTVRKSRQWTSALVGHVEFERVVD